jgi:hypothetical protein
MKRPINPAHLTGIAVFTVITLGLWMKRPIEERRVSPQIYDNPRWNGNIYREPGRTSSNTQILSPDIVSP